ncbi:NAD-dependent epimerase/dehydratase family protein [Salinicoccus bachuensis]|uniref:NAD-dependent epimerase/dehydratase family protein n=1 Tax=Salinicoccus bachuensis TaxID=3136731 RepID=A0ABZ3CK04_9STAP
MNILITGANGFIAKNLIADLSHRGEHTITRVTRDTSKENLINACKKADFVYHLAGVNRPKNTNEFIDGNINFTRDLVSILKDSDTPPPILITSSIQAENDTPYGKSKKSAEDMIFSYGAHTGARILVYRLPNVFGKWCKPNYNSVVATFCNNITHNKPVQVNNIETQLSLVYIEDVIKEFKSSLYNQENRKGDFCKIEPIYQVKLGDIVDLLRSFKKIRESHLVPDMNEEFTKKLYSTYLSYLPKNEFKYDLEMNVDERGSFTEFLKTEDRGQVSVNISKPGIVKGNHWHHTKNEKFLVVSGKGIIRLRNIYENEILEYHVTGEYLEVVDIPPGYTHNIENLGNEDMITIMWANELYDVDKPDTFHEEV